MTLEPTPIALRELAAIDAALAGEAVEPDLADVAELTRALRAERPAPDLAFARELDAWAERGFGARDPRRPHGAARKRPRKRFVLLRPQAMAAFGAAAALALGVAVIPTIENGSDDSGGAGGSAASETASEEPSAGAPGSAAPQTGIEDLSGSAAESAPPAGGEDATALRFDRESAGSGQRRAVPRTAAGAKLATPPPAGTAVRGRFVEHSAAMTLAMPPDELEGVAAGVSRVTGAAGGYIARSSVTADPAGGSADFELRVPSRRLNAVLTDLSELADVRTRTQATDDITATVASARERVAEARAERRGLLRRLARSGDPLVRERLRAASARLREAQADQRRQLRRADLATVAVTLVGDPKAGAGAGGDGRWTPGDALRDAARVLEVVAGIALIALAVALPLLLLGAPLVVAGRRRAQRGRERALDAV